MYQFIIIKFTLTILMTLKKDYEPFNAIYSFPFKIEYKCSNLALLAPGSYPVHVQTLLQRWQSQPIKHKPHEIRALASSISKK